MKQITTIDAPAVFEYDFVEKDVLANSYHQELRKDTLFLSMVLGNNYGKRVQMQVVTTEETVELHGIVLAMNEGMVFLKGGTKVPVHAIAEVKVY
ncbi:MAG: hypothetical protein KF706_10455 [Chitinophagales bacterium]|nr:hypothetical protein [Chitinophagales bacterium]OJV24248.1 MAG: hypothetical protein BGO32_04370 [Bacteroidetes bacterium 37-13]HRN93527.1 hypothetical protein [Chitinophagales bacterium]HRP39243.1 hypothetical protein [Chitinophagales bacterium]